MAKTLQTTIQLNGKINKSLRQAYKIAQSDAGKTANAIGNAFKKAAGIASAAFAAIKIGDFIGDTINVGKEFESAMSQVSATMLLDKSTEEGRKNFEILENAAREMGSQTAFSATEAAEALNYLALAGYDAGKAADALPTVLRLAGAGTMELAQASDLVTDAMSALNIEATKDNLDKFADQMAMTASKSNTSVAQLGEATLAVGGTAANLKGGITELNTVLGILADNGIKAAEGGTHLRNMLLSLETPRNKEANNLMHAFDFSAYDAEGKLRSLGDMFSQLNNEMLGMTDAQKDGVIATLFKQTDLAAARAMLAATTDDVSQFTFLLNDSMKETGRTLSDLGIDGIESLKKIYESSSDQSAFVASLEKIGMDANTASLAYSGLGAIIDGTGNRYKQLTSLINDSAGAAEKMYGMQLDNLEGDQKILSSTMDELKLTLFEVLDEPLRQATQFGTKLIGNITDGLKEVNFGTITASVSDAFEKTITTVKVGFDWFLESFEKAKDFLSGESFDYLRESFDGFGEAVRNIIPSLKEFFGGFAGSAMENAVPILKELAIAGADITAIYTNVKTVFVNMLSKAMPGLTRLGNTIFPIIRKAVEGISQTIASLTPHINNFITSASPLFEGLAEIIGNSLGKIGEVVNDKVMPALTVMISGMVGFVEPILDAISPIIDGIGEAFNALIPYIQPVIDFLINALGDQLKNTFNGIGIFFTSIGNIIGAAINIIVACVRTFGENIFTIIETIKTVFDDIIIFIRSTFAGDWQMAWDSIKNIFETVWNGLKTIAANTVNGIIDIINSILQGVKNVASKIPGAEALVNFELIPHVAFAKGGTVTSPTMALIGEAGDAETIIPHNSNQRSKDLLNVAARGVYGDSAQVVSGKASGNTYNVTYSPVINGGAGSVKEELRQSFEEFKQYFEQMTKENDREVFA